MPVFAQIAILEDKIKALTDLHNKIKNFNNPNEFLLIMRLEELKAEVKTMNSLVLKGSIFSH